ncbi:hypothetical protein HT031_004781 [Scenedesmus sp. PABB004]|nr:hypothetical protein HT031_004781 [Scenedesmus sp. PABB004]
MALRGVAGVATLQRGVRVVVHANGRREPGVIVADVQRRPSAGGVYLNTGRHGRSFRRFTSWRLTALGRQPGADELHVFFDQQPAAPGGAAAAHSGAGGARGAAGARSGAGGACGAKRRKLAPAWAPAALPEAAGDLPTMQCAVAAVAVRLRVTTQQAAALAAAFASAASAGAQQLVAAARLELLYDWLRFWAARRNREQMAAVLAVMAGD